MEGMARTANLDACAKIMPAVMQKPESVAAWRVLLGSIASKCALQGSMALDVDKLVGVLVIRLRHVISEKALAVVYQVCFRFSSFFLPF